MHKNVAIRVKHNERKNTISRQHLQSVLKEGIKDNGVIFDENEIAQMVNGMLVECKDNLTFPNIIKILDGYPELYESLSLQ